MRFFSRFFFKTELYWVFFGLNRFLKIILSSVFYLVFSRFFSCFNGWYWVFSGFTEFYLVLLGVTWLRRGRVLPVSVSNGHRLASPVITIPLPSFLFFLSFYLVFFCFSFGFSLVVFAPPNRLVPSFTLSSLVCSALGNALFTGFYLVLLGFTGFYLVLLIFT